MFINSIISLLSGVSVSELRQKLDIANMNDILINAHLSQPMSCSTLYFPLNKQVNITRAISWPSLNVLHHLFNSIVSVGLKP